MSDFDVIVVGGGHAGIEAARAASAIGASTLLISLNRSMIGNTPCNPHIGGSAKGIVVREVDALGGLMGLAADIAPLQIKMLNESKGPGVRCLRAQVAKHEYPAHILALLSRIHNLTILEGEVCSLLFTDGRLSGIRLLNGREITAKSVVLTTGTYLDASVIRGQTVKKEGPDGEKSSLPLAGDLRRLGLELVRFKTGTPPRLDYGSIDFSKAQIQLGEDGPLAFSYLTTDYTPLERQLPCYIVYTNEKTHELIRAHLFESAVYNGIISGIGPRYCPSIESKLVRFPDHDRHQLFLEPEERDYSSVYLQGFSTGFDEKMQEQMVHTIVGLEKAKIIKYAYQIEYDAISSFEFDHYLRVKKVPGLFGAGQIVGTSGYEEAAGLGLVAGANAALSALSRPLLSLGREEAYIGVMIDDLVTKGADEPYRLLSSRAEHRLLLRHDNADLRLTEKGYQFGLVDDNRYRLYLQRKCEVEKAVAYLEETRLKPSDGLNSYLRQNGYEGISRPYLASELLTRGRLSLKGLLPLLPESLQLSPNSTLTVETEIKFRGYIEREEKSIAEKRAYETEPIPEDIDYSSIKGLRNEAREKLGKFRPLTVGEAGRIPGVNPADTTLLLLYLKKAAHQ